MQSTATEIFQQMLSADDVDQVIATTAGISGILSVLGSITVMICLCYFRGFFSNFEKRLLFCVSIADIFASLSYVIHFSKLDKRHQTFCVIEAILMDVSELSAVFWCTCIVIYISMNMLSTTEKAEKMEFLYHLISWGYPLIWCIVLCICDRYGWEKYWCWIESYEGDGFFSWRFFSYLPKCILLGFNAVAFVVNIILLRRFETTKQTRFSDRVLINRLLRLSMFVLPLYITWIPAILNRFIEYLNPDGGPYFLAIAQALTNPLQGFLNLIVFACIFKFGPKPKGTVGRHDGFSLNRSNQLKTTNWCSCLFGWCKRSSHVEDETDSVYSIARPLSPVNVKRDIYDEYVDVQQTQSPSPFNFSMESPKKFKKHLRSLSNEPQAFHLESVNSSSREHAIKFVSDSLCTTPIQSVYEHSHMTAYETTPLHSLKSPHVNSVNGEMTKLNQSIFTQSYGTSYAMDTEVQTYKSLYG
jgi:hypothetical protein